MRERSRFESELRKIAVHAAVTPQLGPIEVVDEREAPLDREFYTASQGTAVDRGTLKNGRLELSTVDPSRPFTFEIDGRVLAIKDGALLCVDDPAAEYGGTFVDWALADDPKKADTVFWPQYAELRRTIHEGPSTFWQHEHLTRRRLRLRTGYGVGKRLAALQAVPLRIRTGPILRFTSPDRAVVWLELETPGLVRASYCEMTNQRQAPQPGPQFDDKGCTRRHSATVRVGGRHFAMVVLDELKEETLYRYTLELAPMPATAAIPFAERDFKDEWFSAPSRAVKEAIARQLQPASLRGDPWLFVRTLRRRYERLRFVHGSCRRWPGDAGEAGASPGEDMLEALGECWLPEVRALSEWPSFVLHTGDQIYADDIGVHTGRAIAHQRFGARVPGPLARDDLTGGAWAGRFAHRFLAVSAERLKVAGTVEPLEAKERKLGQEVSKGLDKVRQQNASISPELMRKLTEFGELQGRIEAARRQTSPSDFITDPKHMRSRHMATNHFLWRIPIYAKDLPQVKVYKIEGRGGGRYPSAGETRNLHAADFAEFAYLYEKAWTTPYARKVLANLPQFMIFDDHEITDDWNMNKNWVDVVNTKQDDYSYWPNTITDGISAYWMYQGWGNLSPSLWGERKLAEVLVEARKSGKDALPMLRRAVAADAARPPGRLVFHYSLPIDSPKVLVADLRTRKQLRSPDEKSSAFDKRQLDWLRKSLKAQQVGAAAFVVMSLPYLVPRFVSFLMRHPWVVAVASRKLAGREEVVRGLKFDMEHPVMTATWSDLQEVIKDLQDSVTPLKSVVLISGDVHMSFNLKANRKEDGYELPPELLQLVSSGSRNSLGADQRAWVERGLAYFPKNLEHSLGPVHVRAGGFEGVRGERKSILFETAIAIVEAKMSSGKVDLRQTYLTRERGSKVLRTWDVYYKRSETERYLTPVSIT